MYNRNYAAEVSLQLDRRRSPWPTLAILAAMLAGFALSLFRVSGPAPQPAGNSLRTAKVSRSS